MADLWKTEIYDRKSKRWKDYGTPSTDFHRVYKDAMESTERGLKVRLTKIQNGDMKVSMSGKDVTFSVPETPEQKMPAAEAPEGLNSKMPKFNSTCLFKAHPYQCEYCNEKQCPVSEAEYKKAMQELGL